MSERTEALATSGTPAAGGVSPTEPAAPPKVSKWAIWFDRLGPRRLSAVYLAATFLVVFTLLNPGTYFTSTTMTVVFSSGVVTCLLALAFLVPLTTEAYDLSIGTMLTFSLTLCVKLNLSTGLPLVVIALICLLCCALVGAVSGFLIVRLHINSFIATLGVSQVLLAAVLLISSNTQLVGTFPSSWSSLGNNTVDGIPIPLFFLVGLAAVMWYVFEFTRVGRFLFATGGNATAARLSGIHTDRLVWGSMIVSAVISGFAGLIYSMQIGVAVSTVGDGLLFPAVAAVFLGASQLSQRPNVWGTLIAYFTLAFGIQGLTLTLGASAAWAGPLFQGVSLIIAVAVASRPVMRNLRARKAIDALVPGDAAPIHPNVSAEDV
jgi:ribose transport system permease protein